MLGLLVIAFLAALLEALPAIGLAVPGMTFLAFTGFLASHGRAPLILLFIAGSLGAFLGDLGGYLLGRLRGVQWLFSHGGRFGLARKRVATLQKGVRRHAAKTLIFGRFNSLTRSFTPFLAGASKVGGPRFVVAAALGGILWSGAILAVGFLAGTGYKAVLGRASLFVSITLLLAALVFIVFNYLEKKWPLLRRRRWLILLNLFSLWLFAKLLEDVFEGEFATRIDAVVRAGIHPGRWLVGGAKLITIIGNAPFFLLASTLLILLLFWRKRVRDALWSAALLFSGFIIVELVKVLVARPRPSGGLVPVVGFSFPSGHAAMTLLFTLCVLSLVKNPGWLFITLLIPFLVGASRVVLGVHWLTDVIAGFALAAWLWTIGALWRTWQPSQRMSQRTPPSPPLSLPRH